MPGTITAARIAPFISSLVGDARLHFPADKKSERVSSPFPIPPCCHQCRQHPLIVMTVALFPWNKSRQCCFFHVKSTRRKVVRNSFRAVCWQLCETTVVLRSLTPVVSVLADDCLDGSNPPCELLSLHLAHISDSFPIQGNQAAISTRVVRCNLMGACEGHGCRQHDQCQSFFLEICQFKIHERTDGFEFSNRRRLSRREEDHSSRHWNMVNIKSR